MNNILLNFNDSEFILDNKEYLITKEKVTEVKDSNNFPELGNIKIKNDNDKVTIISDIVNSIELYLKIINNKIIISNYIERENINKINDNFIKDFNILGHTINEDTIYQNIKLLPASSIITINKKFEFSYSFQRLFENKNFDQKLLDSSLTNLFNKKKNDLTKYDKVIIFLSSGLDSRVVLKYLLPLNLNNLSIAVFGSINNDEYKHAKKIALSSGLEFLNLGHKYLIKNQNKKKLELNKFFQKYNFTYVPNIDFFSACYDLKQIYNDKKIILLNGNSGDYADGRQKINSLDHFIEKFMLFDDNVNDLKVLKNRFKKYKYDFPSFSQKYNYINRQSKYVISARYTYEYFNFDHWHPLWENDFLINILGDDHNNFERSKLFLNCLSINNNFNLPTKRLFSRSYPNNLKYLFIFNKVFSYVFGKKHILNLLFYWGNFSHVYQLYSFFEFFKVLTKVNFKTQSRGIIYLSKNRIIQTYLKNKNNKINLQSVKYFCSRIYKGLLININLNLKLNKKISSFGPYYFHIVFLLNNFKNWGENEKNNCFKKLIEYSLNKDCVIDVGSHIGLTSMPMSDKISKKGKIHCFEPSKKNLFLLKKHIKFNKIKNIIVNDNVVGDQNIDVDFFEKKDHSPINSIILNQQTTNYNLIKRNMITIDQYVKNNNLCPDIIKIDVEGAEYLVLKGLKTTIQKYNPIIFLSVHPNHFHLYDYTFQDLIKLINSLNLKLLNNNENNLISNSENSEYMLKQI